MRNMASRIERLLAVDHIALSPPARVLEFGAGGVGFCLRDHLPPDAEYVALNAAPDIASASVAGASVFRDVPDAHFDLVAAMAVPAADIAFWSTISAMCRKARPGGHIVICAAPGEQGGPGPRYDTDTLLSVEARALADGLQIALVESFVTGQGEPAGERSWSVFRRGQSESIDDCHLPGRSRSTPSRPGYLSLADQAEQDMPNRQFAENQTETMHNEDKIRKMTARSPDLESRFAKRDGKSPQVRGAAEGSAAACESPSVEAADTKRQLDDANAWIEKLVRDRAQLERRVDELSRELAKQSRDFASLDKVNAAFAERLAALSADPRAKPSPNPDGKRVPARSGPKDTPVFDQSGSRSQSLTAGQEPSEARLEETYGEIAVLTKMVVAAQDRIDDLEWQNGWLREAGSFLLERGKWWWRFMPLGWQRRKRDARLRRRGIFDAAGYVARYPDVAGSGQEPFRHYLHHGIEENRRFDGKRQS